MRIVVDASCWGQKRGYGRFSRELIQALVAEFGQQHEFILLTDSITVDHSDFPSQAKVEPVKTQEQQIQAASSGGARSLADMLRFGLKVKKLAADVIFFPAPYTYFPILGRTPMVMCIHDAMTEARPEWFFGNRSAHWRWKTKLWLARMQANRIICPSEQAREDVARAFGMPIEGIDRVVEAAAAGFTELADDQDIPSVLARYGVSPGLPLVLYVGGISPHKNLDGLVRAMADLKTDAQLVIVGDEKRDSALTCGPELRQTISHLGLSERVTFTGFMPDDDLVATYNAASLLVLPSFEEGFGLPVIEAMACGTPVAVSHIGALVELAGDAGLVFDPSDVSDMTSGIDRILQSAELQESMRQRGLERAEGYSWGRAAEQTMSVLEQAASG
jgi:glycosyltransferase involved in cell wall biosynthesis